MELLRSEKTLKEIGKFALDLAKIIFAVAILPTLLKNGSINWYGILSGIILMIGGIFVINKGVENESTIK